MEDKGYEIRSVAPCDVCEWQKKGYCWWHEMSCGDVKKCEFAPLALEIFKRGR